MVIHFHTFSGRAFFLPLPPCFFCLTVALRSRGLVWLGSHCPRNAALQWGRVVTQHNTVQVKNLGISYLSIHICNSIWYEWNSPWNDSNNKSFCLQTSTADSLQLARSWWMPPLVPRVRLAAAPGSCARATRGELGRWRRKCDGNWECWWYRTLGFFMICTLGLFKLSLCNDSLSKINYILMVALKLWNPIVIFSKIRDAPQQSKDFVNEDEETKILDEAFLKPLANVVGVDNLLRGSTKTAICFVKTSPNHDHCCAVIFLKSFWVFANSRHQPLGRTLAWQDDFNLQLAITKIKAQ